MIYTDGSLCPWKGRRHLKMMEVPATFLRWALRERPAMVDGYPGMRAYVESRVGATGIARSATRDAREHGERGKTPRELGLKRGAPAPRKTERPAEASAARAGGAVAGLSGLAEAMRRATQ